MQILRQLIREQILIESDPATSSRHEGGWILIRYSSAQDLAEKLIPYVQVAWEKSRNEALRLYPEHKKVIERTRFVPFIRGVTQIPDAIFHRETDDSGSWAVAQFISKCNNLFTKSRIGVSCRAEGNLENPPTHNAIYLGIKEFFNITKENDKPGSMWFTGDDKIREAILHEFAHAIDMLSGVVGKGKLRNISSAEIDALIDDEALIDKEVGMQRVEDRMIAAGASDHLIDLAINNYSIYWDKLISWFSNDVEYTAAIIQFATVLSEKGVTGRDFIGSNIFDMNQELGSDILSHQVQFLLYGILEDSGIDEIEKIQDEIL